MIQVRHHEADLSRLDLVSMIGNSTKRNETDSLVKVNNSILELDFDGGQLPDPRDDKGQVGLIQISVDAAVDRVTLFTLDMEFRFHGRVHSRILRPRASFSRDDVDGLGVSEETGRGDCVGLMKAKVHIGEVDEFSKALRFLIDSARCNSPRPSTRLLRASISIGYRSPGWNSSG